MYSFAIDEIKLYLDTHPNCRNGLEYYHKYKKLYREAVDEYVRIYGPLTADSVESKDCWTWVNEPWPWERSGN
jgi:spore coat protein JB